MALIVGAIKKQAPEIIRDKITELLGDELDNQFVLSYDDILDASVWMERIVPFDVSELRPGAINIMQSQGDYNNEDVKTADGTYTYFIDCYAKGIADETTDGDSLAMLKLQRLVSVVRAILMATQYKNLNIQQQGVYIRRRRVASVMYFSAPSNREQQSNTDNIVSARITFEVVVPEDVELVLANLEQGSDTAVNLYCTDKGYIWSRNGSNPAEIPVAPCPGYCGNAVVDVNGNFFGTVEAGQTIDVPVQYASGQPVGVIVDGVVIVPNPEGGTLIILDEGDIVSQVAYSLNFEGAGVTVTVDANGQPTVTIPAVPETPLTTKEDGTTVSANTTTLNFTGAGATATETSPGVVEVNIPGADGSGIITAIAFSADHLTATGNGYVIGNVVWYNGNIYQCIADNDSILPTNATYWTSLGAGLQTIERPTDWDATTGNNQILNKPSIPAAQVNSDWNAVSGVEEILNKPSIPAAQIQSDWTQANNVALDFIKNKPTIPAGGLPAGGTAGQILSKVDATDYNATWQENYADWTSVVKHTVKNDGASGTITKGTAVYVTGSNGTNMLVGRASNASEPTSSKTMGLMQSDITTTGGTQTGFVITEGLLGSLNTAGTTAGDPVWLGVNGALIYGLANKPYAPAHLVFIGIVTKVSAGNGEIFVKVQNGFELKEIHDVDIITVTPINGHVLGFDGTLWVNKTVAGWLGFTPVTNARTLTINGTAQDLSADRSWTIPALTVFKDTTTGTASSGTSNTVSKTQLIPANTFAVGDIIQVDWGSVNKTGIVGTQTLRMYVNATADIAGSPVLLGTYTTGAPAAGGRADRRLVIKSATATETSTGTTNLITDLGFTQLTAVNIDWTLDRYFVFTIQNTLGLESSAISYFRIVKT